MADSRFKRLDINKGALVNVDTDALHHYKLRKRISQEKESELAELRNQIAKINEILLELQKERMLYK